MVAINLIVKFSGEYEEFISQLVDTGVFGSEDLGSGYAALDIEREYIDRLYSYPVVEDIELPRDTYINDFRAAEYNCPSAPEFRSRQFGGQGVLVGIIDTGVDYTNPEFRHPDGSTRIKYFWDQTAEGTPPGGFLSGAEYTSEMIDNALVSSDPLSVIPKTDTSGHGTAVAGIAAGNNIGRAFESELIAVRVGRQSSEQATTIQLMRGLYYIIKKAFMLKMPVSINISYGMNEGSHRGDSLFEKYITDVGRIWKTCITVPTGNEGSAGHHYEGQLVSGESLDIGFFTAPAIRSFYLSIWKDFTDPVTYELILPDGKSTGILGRINNNIRVTADGMSISAFYGQPSRRSVFQEVFYDIRPDSLNIPAGLWTLRVKAENIVNGHFDIWLPTTEQVTLRTFFTDPSDNLTMTIPSTAPYVIKVAGFDKRTNSAALFSGLGTEYPINISPDVAASAINVSAPTLSGGIGSFTGTSFASPLAAGIAAQLMQWGIVCGNSPFMYGEKLRAQLHFLASRIDGRLYPDTSIGYGILY